MMILRPLKPVYLNKQGKQIGEIMRDTNNKLFFMTKRKPIHYFIKFQGYGMDKTLLRRLLEEGIEHIIIKYEGKRGIKWLYSLIDRWFLRGYSYGTAKEYDDDIETFGEQIILPEKYMEVIHIGVETSHREREQVKERVFPRQTA